MSIAMHRNPNHVLRLSDCDAPALCVLLSRFGLTIETVADGAAIEGSFWGAEEAGLLGMRLLARSDTPLHSILHETCHYICMDARRRGNLDTDAGGDFDEENAVCYLQILLSDTLPEGGRQRMFEDMDAWGYSFRLGSARAWFENDAQDARQWLINHGIITVAGSPTYRLRGE